MIKIVGYILLLSFCLNALALVPVEGILMGEAKESYQEDPLTFIFSDIYDKNKSDENKKLKIYHNTWTSGSHLTESCGILGPVTYSSSTKEQAAKRAVVSTLQYLGLDALVRAIGAYAKKLEVTEEDYKRLTNNLVKNYCSKNLTVYSVKTIERSLQYYYENPQSEIIPNVGASPFATELFKYRTEGRDARSNEFGYAIQSFRSLCSWGGGIDDYRMLAPYLSNRFIMSYVIKNMQGKKDQWNFKNESVMTTTHPEAVQVVCENLICRKVSSLEFKTKFPLSVGSTGVETDLMKLYCSHFRFEDYSAANTIEQVRGWMKEADLEDPVFETNYFLSLLTGIPDPFMGISNYNELPFLAKSSVDERWGQWSRNVLNVFSKDLMFEESLKVKAVPRREALAIKLDGFKLDFTITLGEMDRLMDETDKLALRMNLKLSKNYLRALRNKWNYLTNEVDLEGKKAFKQEMAHYIGLQLKTKEKFFTQKVWNEDFKRLVADELLEQVLRYRGNLFDSYKEEVIDVPIKFSYGVFAASYLRYRADIKSNGLKLNL